MKKGITAQGEKPVRWDTEKKRLGNRYAEVEHMVVWRLQSLDIFSLLLFPLPVYHVVTNFKIDFFCPQRHHRI